MHSSDPTLQTSNRTRWLAAVGIAVFLLLLGAAGWRSLAQAESIGHEFVTRIHADALTLGDLRTSVDQLRRAEHDVLIAPGNAAQRAQYRAEWDRALARARAQARQLALSRPSERAAVADHVDTLLATYANAAGPVLRGAEPESANAAATAVTALGPARRLVQVAESELTALQGLLEHVAVANEQARHQALQQARWSLAGTLSCALLLVAALTLPAPARAAFGIPDPAPERGTGVSRAPPDDVPTLQPEVVAPGYAGIERRGPDRPRNIVRAEFNPRAAPTARRPGRDGADETSETS